VTEEILRETVRHLVLVGVSIGIATAVGVPLGIFVVRRPAWNRIVLGVVGVLQTIPSLALFGFLIPVPVIGGIGTRTAIVALTLYGLLPVVRNTVTGIAGVDPAIREAGRGMGMTDRQLLVRVELPLAASVILAGVRVATVVGIGVATIAAAIGAGGLGVFIFRGVAMVDNRTILAGALPAAALAVAADLTLGVRAGVAALVAAWAIVAAGCGGGNRIVVGSKNFTEQRILGELLAQTIAAAGLRAERRLDLGGTFVCDAALRAGQIDVYVEYTGTALTAILQEPPAAAPDAVLARVRAAYAPAGLTWTAPLGFDNTFALVVRGDDARRLGLRTVSDAVPHTGRWRAAFGYEFRERADGYPGLVRAYGLGFGGILTMDLGLLYRALVERQADVVAGNATDGLIDHLGLVVLEDDRHAFPPYEAAPVVRRAALARHPPLAAALASLGGTLSAATMRRLNYAVDGEHRDPASVVHAFRAGQDIVREAQGVGRSAP
jgi:osmoprotectant transport system permease protein